MKETESPTPCFLIKLKWGVEALASEEWLAKEYSAHFICCHAVFNGFSLKKALKLVVNLTDGEKAGSVFEKGP